MSENQEPTVDAIHLTRGMFATIETPQGVRKMLVYEKNAFACGCAVLIGVWMDSGMDALAMLHCDTPQHDFAMSSALSAFKQLPPTDEPAIDALVKLWSERMPQPVYGIDLPRTATKTDYRAAIQRVPISQSPFGPVADVSSPEKGERDATD